MPTPIHIALHYQNENCHPDGLIKVGIAKDAPWREERLGNARRLFAGLRERNIPIIHIRLAVRPGYAGIVANIDHVREWIALGAWQEDTWGVEFLDGLQPAADEFVITHHRNSAFHGCELPDVLMSLKPTELFFSGVSTAYAVEGTVRSATDHGYHCTVVSDACATATEQQHQYALAAMQPLAKILTVEELLSTLPMQ